MVSFATYRKAQVVASTVEAAQIEHSNGEAANDEQQAVQGGVQEVRETETDAEDEVEQTGEMVDDDEEDVHSGMWDDYADS